MTNGFPHREERSTFTVSAGMRQPLVRLSWIRFGVAFIACSVRVPVAGATRDHKASLSKCWKTRVGGAAFRRRIVSSMSEQPAPLEDPLSDRASYDAIALKAYLIALDRHKRGEASDPASDWIEAERLVLSHRPGKPPEE
jgi:hypothetical protein